MHMICYLHLYDASPNAFLGNLYGWRLVKISCAVTMEEDIETLHISMKQVDAESILGG